MFPIFQGTNIAAGKAQGVVVGTGITTEIGEWNFKPTPYHAGQCFH